MTVFSNPASSTAADTAAYVAALLRLLGDNDPVVVLGRTPAALQRFLDTVPAELVGCAEAPGKWSVREVVQHLADSELVGGFRVRMVMAHDRPSLTGYDQDLWASRLRYREVDVRDAVEQFTVLRRANLRIWQHLSPADLARVGIHGERGEESLEHLRRLYAAHDLLHLRQLDRIRTMLLPASVQQAAGDSQGQPMELIYFTEDEARREIGNVVEALSDFPSVPKGSRGTIVKGSRHAGDGWVAVVEWDLPLQASFIAAMVMDASVNFMNRSKPTADQFSRSEYETLLRVLERERHP